MNDDNSMPKLSEEKVINAIMDAVGNNLPFLNKEDVTDAIEQGVHRAVWEMITGITDMPSSDFWDTLKDAMEKAFTQVAEGRSDE